MSNNNHPHGHISQPAQNPSWNPLQIPSYIPNSRQPQLAHMSNERPMVRSPLAWHASAQPPPDAIYNFISANHKNLEHHHQMNPLLASPYVSGALPFDSMDLSLQSSRNVASPLNKSVLSQQAPPHQQQSLTQQQSHLHASNYTTIHNLTTNTPGSTQHLAAMAAVQHVHASLLPSSAPPTTPPTSTAAVISMATSKYLNGGDCESLLPPPPTTPTSVTSGNNNVPLPSHYIHASRDENYKLAQLKRSFNHESKAAQKPVDLINKDCSYGTGIAKLAPHNLQPHGSVNKKQSPLRTYHQQQPYSIPPLTNNKYHLKPPTPPPSSQSPLAALLQTSTGTSHGPSHGGPLDYNQLHLHHHLHGSNFSPQQHIQQQEQQHLLYSSHHLPTPVPQQQQQMAEAQYHAHQHQQHVEHRNAQLTNLDSLLKQKDMPMHIETDDQEDERTVITDLSTSSGYRSNPSAQPHLPPPPPTPIGDNGKAQISEAPESPYITTSNEESLESNSNSSSSRKRRKRKSSQVMRLTPSDNVITIADDDRIEQCNKYERTPNQNSSSCSPKRSPIQRMSPKNGSAEYNSSFGRHIEHDISGGESSQENGCVNKVSPQLQLHKTDIVNMADNISSAPLYNDDNPKTKKQRQALLQRNLTEQQRRQHGDEAQRLCTTAVDPPVQIPMPPSPQSNSSSSTSSSSSTHSSHSSNSSDVLKMATTDTPASPALVEQGNIDAKPAISVHDDDEEEDDIDDISQNEDKKGHSEIYSGGASQSCRFVEVENKLEEMFAGIEDEPVDEMADAPSPTKHLLVNRVAQELSDQPLEPLENNAHVDKTTIDKKGDSTPPTELNQPVIAQPTTPIPEYRPMATKASMKSTLPSPIHSPSTKIEEHTQLHAPQHQIMPEVTMTPNRRMPQRRLSMGMDPGRLRFTIDEPVKPKKSTAAKKKGQEQMKELRIKLHHEIDDEKPSTSAAAAAALAARKLSEAAAAQSLVEQKPVPAKTPCKKKTTAAKGKKVNAAASKKNAKNSKQKKQKSRKSSSTDGDSTPASARENSGGSSATDLKLKSPFVLIFPDGRVAIKNTHTSEDVNEKQTKVKKPTHQRKNIRGMHSSTLSNRYDADTTDSTWICVFCKRGPHKLGLGDLFGPYLVSVDCEEYRTAIRAPGAQDIDGLFISTRKRSDMVKGNARNLPAVPATLATIMQAPKITMHKRKRTQPYESSFPCSDDQNESRSSSIDPLDCSNETKFIETFRGMSKTSEHGYEIWMHEDCAVWTNEIQLIGAHLHGLEAAVWDSTRYQCVHCDQAGANICCFERTCKAAAHLPCARIANWNINDKNRKVFCEQHTTIATLSTDCQPTTAALTTASVVDAALPFDINSLP